jgi:hypothetical protein
MKKTIIAAAITLLVVAVVYAQVTQVPVKVNFDQDTTWPIVWRVVAEMEGVSTVGMTGADKKHMVSVWLAKIAREQIGRHIIQQAQVAAHAAGQAQAGAVVATPGD